MFKHATKDRLAMMRMLMMIIIMVMISPDQDSILKIHLLERRRSWMEHWQTGIPHLWQPLASVRKVFLESDPRVTI